MHKFYNIRRARGIENIGHSIYPAVKIIDGYRFSASNSVHKIGTTPLTEVDFNPLIAFNLAKGAKLCDMMSQIPISSIGFLVSERLKVFLQKFNLGHHRFYKGSITSNGQKHDYYYLCLEWNRNHEIYDFSNSSFYKKKYSDNLGELKISSIEDYYRIKKEIGFRYSIGLNRLAIFQEPKMDL